MKQLNLIGIFIFLQSVATLVFAILYPILNLPWLWLVIWFGFAFGVIAFLNFMWLMFTIIILGGGKGRQHYEQKND